MTGERLREIRQMFGWSIYDLASRLDRSYSFVWTVEKGYRKLSESEWQWVIHALGLPPETILRTQKKEPRKSNAPASR